MKLSNGLMDRKRLFNLATSHTRKRNMKIEILGVYLDQIDMTGTIEKISAWLRDEKQRFVVTVNPEFIVAAQKRQEFKDVLNKADIAICDGVGLLVASGGKLTRVTGVDLTEKIFSINSAETKIFLLGGYNDVAKKLKDKYPNANIVGAESGGLIDWQSWMLRDNEQIVNKINESGANILLVAFGQVKQEMWIAKNLTKMPNVKVAVGVGGTFDYLSGAIKRAPAWMRAVGLEWLFRVAREPRRIGRIWNAVVIFNWLIIRNKISNF